MIDYKERLYIRVDKRSKECFIVFFGFFFFIGFFNYYFNIFFGMDNV